MKKILLIIIFFFIFTPKVYGADFSLGHKENISVGDIFTVSVFLDTKSNIINSTELSLSYDTDKLEFFGYKNEGGVLKLWVSVPKEKNGVIHFSGVIPGGVEGTYDPELNGLQKLNLVNLLFKAKKQGVSNFDFTEGKALLHDGQGTNLEVNFINSIISIKEKKIDKDNVQNETPEIIHDEIPPLEFKVYFNDALPESNTPPLLVFSAIDNDSGIAKYQIRNFGKWQDVESPYPVKKNFFNYTLTVRAVDFAGNVRESSVIVPGDVSFGIAIAIVLIILGGFLFQKLLKYKHGKKP